MHQFYTGQKDSGTAKSLEPQHGPRAPLDRPMVLLDKVVEIFASFEFRVGSVGGSRAGVSPAQRTLEAP